MRISDWSSDVCSSDLPDRYTIRAEGTVDRRDLTLLTPAVVTREGAGWRLAKTRLSFAGGEAEIGGHAGGGAVAIDAKLARLPLSILDIGFPGLGLGGSASGTGSRSEGHTSELQALM